MKIRLIDQAGKYEDLDVFVQQTPQKGDTLRAIGGFSAYVTSVSQVMSFKKKQDDPCWLVTVEYSDRKPAEEMTDQEALNWYNNLGSGLLGDDDEEL